MPIYEYQCQLCDLRMEKLQKMSDAPLLTCPTCGKDGLKKLVSAAAFRLKGSGWYETDFKKDGKKNLAGDDAGGKSESSADKSKESGSTESKSKDTVSSKPAAKSDNTSGNAASASSRS